uniref:HSF-type DNA-binding domain-containing protein n=1 Tax=Athene cunicularia TaxID=194338 RepID=A0A663N3L7_ATHCN
CGACVGPMAAASSKAQKLHPDPGSSFHVFDQGQFAKEVLPKYFKHNNMASFVRQLNMYGFRKVVHIEQGGLVKPEKDDTEFQHPYFIRGQEHLLENIKRKVTSVSSIKNEDIKVRQDNVTKLLTDIQVMKGKQESMDSKLIAMKHENEALWREVASLRQKHAQQQKVVNKLIQFLISLVQSNRILGVKRKIPLMLNDSSSAHSMPKYSRQYSLEHVHGASPYAVSACILSLGTDGREGGVKERPISPSAELAPLSPRGASRSGCLRSSPVVRIKEEPPSPTCSPQVEEASPGNPPAVETLLSPSTFIDSILQENEPSTTTAAAGDSTPQPQPQEKCLSVACLDKKVCVKLAFAHLVLVVNTLFHSSSTHQDAACVRRRLGSAGGSLHSVGSFLLGSRRAVFMSFITTQCSQTQLQGVG